MSVSPIDPNYTENIWECSKCRSRTISINKPGFCSHCVNHLSTEFKEIYDKCGIVSEGRKCSKLKGHEGNCFNSPPGVKTLRDEFAMAALIGYLSRPNSQDTLDGLSTACYWVADSMLRHRNK